MIALKCVRIVIATLAPLIEREILYRLSRLRQTIAWLRANYDRPVRVEALAGIAGMSLASFHRHFRPEAAGRPAFAFAADEHRHPFAVMLRGLTPCDTSANPGQ